VSQLATIDNALTPSAVRGQVQLIQQVMAEVMKEGEHYGVIPGCGTKPALLKAGAEKLGLTFRLIPEFKITKTDLPGGHREYEIVCTLSLPDGTRVGEGVGSCSTMESKYRWRSQESFEVTDLPIPKDAKERKAEYRKQGFGMKKTDAGWVWVKFTGDGTRTENPDVADQINTVLKMAKKRAHVDAILTATAASDIFTQDIEERVEDMPVGNPAHDARREAEAETTRWEKLMRECGHADTLKIKWDETEGFRKQLHAAGRSDLIGRLVRAKDDMKLKLADARFNETLEARMFDAQENEQ